MDAYKDPRNKTPPEDYDENMEDLVHCIHSLPRFVTHVEHTCIIRGCLLSLLWLRDQVPGPGRLFHTIDARHCGYDVAIFIVSRSQYRGAVTLFD
jgi:hypothetical protein